MRSCSVEGCTAVHYGRGYCKSHYDKWRRRGSALAPPIPDIEERFWAKVDGPCSPDECWSWTAARDTAGYGVFTVKGQSWRAHRYAYELLVGPIPEGLQLDHLCRNTSCVNPTHLEPVTGRVNVLRGRSIPARNAAKTHCHQGHPYTPENTYRYPKTGHRLCLECRNEWQRERRRRTA